MEKSFLRACIEKWRWFAVSIATTLVIGIAFLLVYAPRYERTATILIKDENGGSGLLSSIAANMGFLAGLGGLGISTNVLNEMEIISSPGMIDKVVNKLELGTRYQAYDGVMKRDLWHETLPIKVNFPQLKKDDGAYMKMDLRKDGTYTLYKLRKNGKKVDGEATGKIGAMCETPIGKVLVIKTNDFDKSFTEDDEMTIRITKERRYDIIDRMQRHLKIGMADDQAEIISISFQDQSEEKAELVVNTLIKTYQEEWLKDKQDEGRNLLPDYEEAAKMYLKNATITYEAQVKVNNYLYMLEQMRNQVKSIEGKNVVLPANLLPDNPNVALEISEYNKLQTKRNAMAANSNDQNPLVQDLDVQLKGMREAIVNSLDQGIAQLRAQQKGVSIEDRKLKGEMSIAPEKITKILPAERQQKIIEALYVYLLEKREENNITHVFNAQNMRLVSPPIGDWKPAFPQKGITLIIAFTLGLALPALLIFILSSLGRWKKT